MGLEVVEFVVELEKALRIEIPDDDFGTFRTPRGLIEYVCRRLPELDPAFGPAYGPWTRSGVEQLVQRLLAKHARRKDFDLDTDLGSLFQ